MKLTTDLIDSKLLDKFRPIASYYAVIDYIDKEYPGCSLYLGENGGYINVHSEEGKYIGHIGMHDKNKQQHVFFKGNAKGLNNVFAPEINNITHGANQYD